MTERVLLLVPETAEPRWVDAATDRARLEITAMADGLGLPPLQIDVVRESGTAAIAIGESRHDVRVEKDVAWAASRFVRGFVALLWPGLIEPALARRGIASSWWLRHASQRGLSLDQLAGLARSGADEDTIAWRLADDHAPDVALHAGRKVLDALGDAALRETAAREAAEGTGLPVEIPGEPVFDPLMEDHEAMIVLGALRGQAADPGALSGLLHLVAPALVDPAVVLALLTDEARIPRRLAAQALRQTGAVTIARRMVQAADAAGPVNFHAIVAAAAGMAPAQ